MRKLTMTVGAVVLSILQGACADHQIPTSPVSPTGRASFSAASSNDRVVSILDACDHDSFGAVGVDCSRNGGVKFDQFINEIAAHGSAGAWHFAASNVNVFAGQTLDVINRGGETHTFTEVKQFGGGIIPLLNDLSGNPVPAPECLENAPGTFVAAGATHHELIDDEGTEMYQCCIHPWMRVIVKAK
jgi:plastocyanin